MKWRKSPGGPRSWHPHAWQTQSLLLAYPDADHPARLALARRVADTLPDPVAEPLRAFLTDAGRTPADDLAAAYVATFDHRKRCCPYLTYYGHGDTRKRGLALLRLKQTYAAAGWRLADDELPDHLAVVLEFAAAEPATGHRLLTEHRAGLELLRLALVEDGSRWAAVLTSVAATLPALKGDERAAVARLAAEGPPEEEVGLAPYPPAASSPSSSSSSAPLFLPDPVFPGGPR
ncbi:nitrate reductase molybdenum cofactor assembly chaperone [Streptomyces sp. NPDC006997]|uniref:nitrate reductase molybdenum cofactor assembly chaperone n=1 Tax=Streptomyces sp. NPDC006997 TaxID=3155356 RepID=UPI0033EE6532